MKNNNLSVRFFYGFILGVIAMGAQTVAQRLSSNVFHGVMFGMLAGGIITAAAFAFAFAFEFKILSKFDKHE